MSPPHRGLPRPQSPGRTCPCPLNLTTGHAYCQLPTRLSVSPKQARARHPTFLARPRCAARHTVGALAIFLERDVSNCRTEKLGWQQVRRWVWREDRWQPAGWGPSEQPRAGLGAHCLRDSPRGLWGFLRAGRVCPAPPPASSHPTCSRAPAPPSSAR